MSAETISDLALLAGPAGDVSRYTIRRVAVLGSGTMGARIAAHIANAGLPVLLLDIVPPSGERNDLGKQAIAKLLSGKPEAFASSAAVSLVSIGNFEDDLAQLHYCDWIIEAVAENLEIKQSLLTRVAEHLHPAAMMTTNTSGLPVSEIARVLPPDLRHRWFGLHFFNPPRYMRLVEIISTPDSDPLAVQTLTNFCDVSLGKEVVPSKDRPNFIANRIGVFSILNTLKLMQEQGLTVEETDVLTGQIIGWPRSGTLRLADMIGIDVLGNIALNFAASGSDERPDVGLPELFAQLMKRNWLGDKTGQGFYKKDRDLSGKEVRLVLDPSSFEYKVATDISLPLIDEVRNVKEIGARIRALLAGDDQSSKAGRFLWRALAELWTYSANRIGEVTDNLFDIDRAMTAGFNWELGPFQMWDAAGVERVVIRMREQNMPVPIVAQQLLAAGYSSWYRAHGDQYFDVATAAYQPVTHDPARAPISAFKRSNGVFAGNSDISLVDIGEGIGCFELHSKMNSLNGAIIDFLRTELKEGSRALNHFEGFVIATDSPNFSVGSDIHQLLGFAQDSQWDLVRQMIENFQDMTQVIKFCSKPVVSAQAGMCLGGGCEITLHSAVRQSHLELSAGLVESRVGLIPVGGGCKEMLLRVLSASKGIPDGSDESVEAVEMLRRVFETILLAKVSTSAPVARSLLLLSATDSTTMNRARLLNDARQCAMTLVRDGYAAPLKRRDVPAFGSKAFTTLQLAMDSLRKSDLISDHDSKIGTHVAHILTAGNVTPGTLVSEQHLLDMERDAFLSLCGETKTQDRMAYTLKTGKPLRN